MKSSRNEGVDIDAGFIHSVRPAVGLKPARTTAPNSVFALGGESKAVTPPETKPVVRSPSRQGRALDTISSCGPMTAEQFASAMELSRKESMKLLWNMKRVGKIELVQDGKVARYSIAKKQAAAAPRWENIVGPGNKTPMTSVVAETMPDPELSCAVFNTGAMLIEVPNSPPLRLTPKHVAELISYLRTLQGGLR